MRRRDCGRTQSDLLANFREIAVREKSFFLLFQILTKGYYHQAPTLSWSILMKPSDSQQNRIGQPD